MRTRTLLVGIVALAAAACRGPAGARGPAPTSLTPPRIESISPAIASVSMSVTVLGSNFGLAPSVTIGGVPATLLSASAGTIVVRPPSTLAAAAWPVVVQAGGFASNPVPLTIAPAGAIAAGPGVTAFFGDGDVVQVGDRVVVTAALPQRGALQGPLTILDAATHATIALAGLGLPTNVAAVRAFDATHVLLLEQDVGRIVELDVDTGTVTPFRSLGVNPQVFDFEYDPVSGTTWYLYGDASNTRYVGRILADGTQDDTWLQPGLPSCDRAVSIAFLAGELYLANDPNAGTGLGCAVDATSKDAAALVLGGAVPEWIGRVRADGSHLALSASYQDPSGGAVERRILDAAVGASPEQLTATLATVALPDDRNSNGSDGGVFPLGGGKYLVTTVGALWQADLGGVRALAVEDDLVASGGAVAAANGKVYATLAGSTTSGQPAALLELDPAANTRRLVAASRPEDAWLRVEDGGGGALFVSTLVGGTSGGVVKVDAAGGAVTPVVSGAPPIADFARDAAGDVFTIDGSTAQAAKYDPQGTLVSASFVTLPATPASIHLDGATIHFAGGGEIDAAPVSGGAGARWSGVQPAQPLELFTSGTAGFGVLSRNVFTAQLELYQSHGDGTLSPWILGGPFLSPPSSLGVAPDGRLLVGDPSRVAYWMLP